MLILKGQTPRRTHDLLALFNSIVALSDDCEGLRSDVLRLAEISASSRYPDDLPPIEMAEVAGFAEAAQNIVAHARHVLKIGEGRTRDAEDAEEREV